VISFIKELGHRISQRSVDDRETQFLFQRLSVIMQRYNTVLYGESFLAASDDPDIYHFTNRFLTLLLIPGISTTYNNNHHPNKLGTVLAGQHAKVSDVGHTH